MPNDYNPGLWEHLKGSLAKASRVHETKHHPGVPYKKMGEFMQDLRAYFYRGYLQCYQGRPPIALCVELIALTACRPSEARLAQRKEFDLDSMIWTVPPEHLKTKHGKTKRVPITKPMLALIKQAEQIAYPKDSSKYKDGRPVFPHARHAPDCSPDALMFPDSTNKAYEEADVARFMRMQMSKWRPATPHGFRTSLKDWWKANCFSMDWWEIQVDHRGDKLDQSYGENDLLDERHGKMELWGEHCSRLAPEPKAGKILNLSSKRRSA